MHPAQHRGLRELFATARQLRAHWLDLAGSLQTSSGGVGAAELRAGSESARELLHGLTAVCAERGLGGRPAAQGLGTRIAEARSALVDSTLEVNQALRLALLDVQHVVTLLDYLARLAAERGDDELRAFLEDWSARLAVRAQAVRDAAIALADTPTPRSPSRPRDSPAGRVTASQRRSGAWASGSTGVQRADAATPALIAGFLSAGECRDLIAEIDAAEQAQAEIWGDGGFGVHPDSRRGLIAALSTATEVLVQDRLWEVVEQLEQRFGCAVSHISGVTALIYRLGDHFAAHSDGGGDDDAPAEVRRRRVSLVVALNDGASDFAGGELEFYAGSLPELAARAEPLSRVRSEPGLLIAFASNAIHRVAPVTGGRRYSLALWALAPPGAPA